MIPKEGCMDIWSLRRQGYSQRQIARKLGIHRRTVKKYLEREEMPVYRKVKRESCLKPYQEMIRDWLKVDEYQATKVYEMIMLQGYKGSYDTVRRYAQKVKEERARVAYIRFETQPGQQAQVDFGEFLVSNPNGKDIKLYCFVMVLGFSRHMYVEFVERCTMPIFLDCHKNAFGYFGGVPGEIVYDNMKNVVIKHLVGKIKFNERMVDFACHYQYKPVACPPYSPWYKGKVERPIDYIRERFWRGYEYLGLRKANADMKKWLGTVAFERVHGTTRQKVSERFVAESVRLGRIPRRPYDTADTYYRKVEKDCRISFDGNFYVMPHKYVGKRILVKVTNGIMRVYQDNEMITAYRMGRNKGEVIAHPRFYEALRKDREQNRRKYRKPHKKGKATIGLRSHNNYLVDVQVRDLTVYEELLEGGASCQN